MKVRSKLEVGQAAQGSGRISFFNRLGRGMVGVGAALGLAGCGGGAMTEEEMAVEMEDVGSVSAAFSQASCATATADFSATGKIDPPHTSPRSYNTCYKGYVADVNNLLAAYTGPGDINARIVVEWADSSLTTETDCEAHRIRAVYYKKVSGDWVVQKDETVWGNWIGLIGGGGICSLGSSFEGMTAGSSYRVAATARTPAEATRKIRIATERPVFIR